MKQSGAGNIRELRPPAGQRRLRVLVVEDNLDSVHTSAALIRTMGHEVQFAINGFAAMDVARSFKPDCILLDIGLPDCKGFDVARQLKWEPGLEKTRIVVITGLPMADVMKGAKDFGCEEIYAKPLAPSVLEDLLARDLDDSPRSART